MDCMSHSRSWSTAKLEGTDRFNEVTEKDGEKWGFPVHMCWLGLAWFDSAHQDSVAEILGVS